MTVCVINVCNGQVLVPFMGGITFLPFVREPKKEGPVAGKSAPKAAAKAKPAPPKVGPATSTSEAKGQATESKH